MLVSEAIEALAIATRADGRSPRTVQSYREKLGHVLTFLGDVPVASITVHDLRRFKAAQLDKGLSQFTVSTRIKAVRRLFNWLVSEGVLSESPAAKVKPGRPEKQPKAARLEDVRAILATAKGDTLADKRDRAAILLLLDSGCRAGGLCGLQVDDVDLAGGLATVHEKGNRTRYAFFGEGTAEALRAWIEAASITEGAVFVALRRRTPLTPSGLWQMIQRRAKQAGVSGQVGVHAFRHCFAKQYLLNGGDLGTLSQILGHKDVRTTVDYYARFAVKELQRQHSRYSPVGKLWGGEYNGEN